MKLVPTCHKKHKLQQLFKQNVLWIWGSNDQERVESMKLLLMTAPVLKFFSPDEPVIPSSVWPAVAIDIEKMAHNCEMCRHYQRSNQKEPLMNRELLDNPMDLPHLKATQTVFW